MAKQLGACAFSASCIMPGPRVHVPGTNIEYCGFHAQAVAAPLSDVPVGLGAGRLLGQPRRARRRSSWLGDYAGVGSW